MQVISTYVVYRLIPTSTETALERRLDKAVGKLTKTIVMLFITEFFSVHLTVVAKKIDAVLYLCKLSHLIETKYLVVSIRH